jgi:hypothetical protein
LTTADLLFEIALRGARLVPEGDHLRPKVLPGTSVEDLREPIRAHKAQILALLRVLDGVPAPAGRWDPARARATLAAVGARLDWIRDHLADTPARRDVLDTYRGAVARLAHRRDPLLWDIPQAVEMLVDRWRQGRNRTVPTPHPDSSSLSGTGRARAPGPAQTSRPGPR